MFSQQQRFIIPNILPPSTVSVGCDAFRNSRSPERKGVDIALSARTKSYIMSAYSIGLSAK